MALNCISGTGYNQYEPYGYDSLNRLTSIVDNGSGSDSSQTYGYDPYGNMFLTNNIGSLPISPMTPGQGQIDSAHNRLTTAGTAYDADGNLLATGSPQQVMLYDGEGRMYETFAGDGEVTIYRYDGDGRRVMKTSGDTTVYVYDAFGQLAAEYSNSDVVPPCETCYISWDHLGTTRLVTDEFGNMVSRHDFLPFGGEIIAGYAGRPSPWGGMDNVNQKFTGKERDSESGLDYFGARYYGSALGRFSSPDDGSDQDSGNPQSWNLYAYGRNSPLNGTDPSGRDWQVCESNGSNCATVTNDAAFDKFNKDTGNYVQGGNYYDSDGNQIGSASWSAPNTDLAGATMIGRTSVVANDIALGFGVMSAGLGGGVAYGALAGGEAVVGLGLQGAARAAALSLPGGAKLAQMISRGGGEFAQNPSGFLSSMRDFVVNAVQEGTYAFANQIDGAGATIYKSGNDYLVVANSGKILSYVPNATPGVGVVTAYYQAGGR